MEISNETAMKSLRDSSLHSINNRGEAKAEAEGINLISKRPRTAKDGDGFEEFCALLKRIEATHRYCLRTRDQLNPQETTLEYAKKVASNASWRPSFEWEDFSSRGNGTRDVEFSLPAVKAGDGPVEEEEGDSQASKDLKREASTNPNLEGLDLNILPAELTLLQ